MKNLLIVENPLKARTIFSIFLKNKMEEDWVVLYTEKNLFDFPKDSTGLTPNEGFEVNFVVKNKKNLSVILREVEKCFAVYIGTDDTIYGEGLAFQLRKVILENYPSKIILRIRPTNITETEILNSISSPDKFNTKFNDCFLLKTAVDSLLNNNIHKTIKNYLGKNLNFDRFSFYILKFLVEREMEIINYDYKTYYILKSYISDDTVAVSDPIKTFKLSKEVMDKIIKYSRKIKVYKLDVTPMNVKAPQPLSLMELMRYAISELKLKSSNILWQLKQLYDTGLITRYNTMENKYSEEFIKSSKKYIKSLLGDEFVRKDNNFISEDDKEGIRPISIKNFPANISLAFQDLYRLIWRRSIACSSTNKDIKNVKISFDIGLDNKMRVLLNCSDIKVVFPGYDRILNGEITRNAKIGSLTKLSHKIRIFQEKSKGPKRYTEFDIFQFLYDLDPNRLEYFDKYINILEDNFYIKRVGNYIQPTIKGIFVLNFIKEWFSDVLDIEKMITLEKNINENYERLDRIKVLGGLYDWFINSSKKLENEFKESNITCPNCSRVLTNMFPIGGEMYLFCRKTENSGCNSYFAVDLTSDGKIKIFKPYKTKDICTNCGGNNVQMVNGKYGLYRRCNDCQKVLDVESII